MNVIDLKLDIEPSLTPQRDAAASEVAARSRVLPAVHCVVKPIGGA